MLIFSAGNRVMNIGLFAISAEAELLEYDILEMSPFVTVGRGRTRVTTS